jgi:cold shock CspA family protein
MRLSGSDRAATPLDFVPAEGKNPADPDLAEAIFGWVEEKGSGPKGQYASRVTFSNARLVNPNQDVWLRSEPSIPHTLSAPKPTTFQHYLIQSKSDKHDPNSRQNLAHYGTPPRETGIRGFKCYWHKGEQPDWEATAQEREHEDQLTRIMPLKPGVQFTFRIHFENLRPEELGVLWWALTLPGREGETYRHKLGMGKPLGMGAVAIRPTLVLSERKERYQTLLSTTGWEESVREAKADQYVKEFEHYVLRESGGNANRLIDVERIQMLLAMLQWPGPNPAWTRYMEIEHPISEEETINEYKERPVLPDPLAVIEQSKSQATPAPIVSAPIRRGRTEEVALPAGFQKGKVVTLGTRNNPDIGFIRPENGDNDVFFHRNQIAADSRDLKNGDRVRFKVIQGARGKPQARDIHRTK